MYLHYIHIDKNWYYWFSNFESNKKLRPYEGSGRIDNDLILFAENISKSSAKKLLKEKFPNYEPILSYPYHKSPRNGKDGSRPIKITMAKDCYREIREKIKKR